MPTRRKPTELATNEQLAQLVAINQTLSRLDFAAALGYTHQGARDMYGVLGYKPSLSFEDCWFRYKRGDIASRIVNAPADATWRTPPLVYEGEEPSETQFERDWEELTKRLRLWHYLSRVDRLAGIGQYAVLLIGVKGAEALSTPMPKLKGPQDVLYLAPYAERSATIHTWVVNPTDPRFGKPETYQIDLGGMLTKQSNGVGLQMSAIVHHSRVLHVSDGLVEDDVFGTPRLEAVFNRLEDLEKVVGGSAEMFWAGARNGMAFKAQKDANLPLTGPDADAMRDHIDEFYHGLRRFVRLNGVDVENLGGNTPDPSGNVDKIISLISGTTRIPQRILTGSERGELGSSQDEVNWNAYLAEREEIYAEPLVLRALIDRFVEYGAITAPTEEYTCEWASRFEMSDNEKADIGLKKSQSIATYANAPGADMLVPPSEFRREVLNLSDEPDPKDMQSIVEPEEDEDEEAQRQFEEGRKAA